MASYVLQLHGELRTGMTPNGGSVYKDLGIVTIIIPQSITNYTEIHAAYNAADNGYWSEQLSNFDSLMRLSNFSESKYISARYHKVDKYSGGEYYFHTFDLLDSVVYQWFNRYTPAWTVNDYISLYYSDSRDPDGDENLYLVLKDEVNGYSIVLRPYPLLNTNPDYSISFYKDNNAIVNIGRGFLGYSIYSSSRTGTVPIWTAEMAMCGISISTEDTLIFYTLGPSKQRSTISQRSDDDAKEIVQWIKNASSSTYNPYTPVGPSAPTGGDGSFDFSSINIPIPSLPLISASDASFFTMYNPSKTELNSLAKYMWSGSFDINNLKKLFANPMDAILGLQIIPTASGGLNTVYDNLWVGNINTGLTMPAVMEQYYEFDCGTVYIPPRWGSYLDYSPYTKLKLYLPYIGTVPISIDSCMRGSIQVKYIVDVLSGTCVAFVYCTSNFGADGHVLYTFTGSCSCQCPITSGQYQNGLLGTLKILGDLGSIATPAGILPAVNDVVDTAVSMIKPEIKHSNSIGGSAGLMGIQYPYLILEVPHMCIPGDQNKYLGYPSFITKNLGELNGFSSVVITHLNNMTCTDEEADEIIELLSEGVIF